MDPRCHIELFGQLRLIQTHQTVTHFARQKAAILLAYLALYPRQHPREHLIDLLWPDLDLPSGRDNLSTTLSSLRRQIEPTGLRRGSVLIATHALVGLNPEAVTTDVVAFEQLIAQAEHAESSEESTALLHQALALYRGDLLPGIYEDWAVREADRLRLHADEARQRLESRGIAANAQSVGTDAGIARVPPVHAPLPNTVPLLLDRFFGREAEMDTLYEMLLKPNTPEETRLVTITGAGGHGKTRLAAQFADHAAGRGVWCSFVPWADVTAADGAAERIADALRLSPDSGTPVLDRITRFLYGRPRPALLVLDNLEHLLPAHGHTSAGAGSASIQNLILTLLKRVPDLRCLCTSRRRLGVRGERVLRLAPLAVPNAQTTLTPPELLRIPSVGLYVDRARAARPDFTLSAANAPLVSALCRQLEGSPLALELAAAWIRIVPLRAMWDSVSRQGGVDVAARHGDLPERHRSLRAALDGSFHLLSPDQKRFFACLSVFRDGWTPDAAAAVCGTPDALWRLSDLEEAALVRAEGWDDAEPRYRVLETVRQYAAEKLSAEEDADAVRARHRDYFLTRAREAQGMLTGPGQAGWLYRLSADHENIRAAVDYCLREAGGIDTGIQLMSMLGRYWYMRGHWSEQRQILTRLLERGGASPKARADALSELGDAADLLQDTKAAQEAYLQSLALYESIGDAVGAAECLRSLGRVAHARRDYEAARSFFTRCLELRRQAGGNRGIADVLQNLGLAAHAQGDIPNACALYKESLALSRASGYDDEAASVLTNLSEVARDQGRFGEAQSLLEERLVILRRLGNGSAAANTLLNMSRLADTQGDTAPALSRAEESLSLYRELGQQDGIAEALRQIGRVSHALGNSTRAEATLKEAQMIRRQLNQPQDHDA